jgi:hypothetical protein
VLVAWGRRRCRFVGPSIASEVHDKTDIGECGHYRHSHTLCVGHAPVLVWGDDFNGPKGARPNPARWVYDTGSGERGWGNNELESYTDSPEEVSLDGKGNLVIRAVRTGLSSWLSGRIKTQSRFEFQYGQAEARRDKV